MIRTHRAVTVCGATMVGVAALAGCAATAGGQSAQSATSAATPSASPSDHDAYVRGTKIILTNNTGSDFTYSPFGTTPQTYSATLANGASVTFGDDYQTFGNTDAYGYLKKGATEASWTIRMHAHNDWFGTPYFSTCGLTASSTETSGASCESKNETTTILDESNSKVVDITKDGTTVGKVTVTRNADDDDNKYWSAVVTSVS